MLNLNEETGEAYLHKVRAQIKEMGMAAQMFLLDPGLESSSPSVRFMYQQSLENMNLRFNEVEKWLGQYAVAAESDRDELRSRIDQTMRELRYTIEALKRQTENQ